MFIPKLKSEYNVVGDCCARDEGIELISRTTIQDLEILVGESISHAWIFLDKISTLILEVDNELYNEDILEDCIGYVVILTAEEIEYLIQLES